MLFLFLEMTLNIDTISTTTHLHCPEDVREAWAIQRSAKEVVIIDSLDIVAHRLFGPLPRTSTYFCIWEFHVGNVAGRLTALEARTLAASGRQFGLNFTDPMNAPAPEYEIPSDPDGTTIVIWTRSGILKKIYSHFPQSHNRPTQSRMAGR